MSEGGLRLSFILCLLLPVPEWKRADTYGNIKIKK